MQRYHQHARLTTHGRTRRRHAVVSGASVTDACRIAGVSRTTYYRGKQRFVTEGIPGLADRSSRPRCPRMALTPDQKQAIAGMVEWVNPRASSVPRMASLTPFGNSTATGFASSRSGAMRWPPLPPPNCLRPTAWQWFPSDAVHRRLTGRNFSPRSRLAHASGVGTQWPVVPRTWHQSNHWSRRWTEPLMAGS